LHSGRIIQPCGQQTVKPAYPCLNFKNQIHPPNSPRLHVDAKFLRVLSTAYRELQHKADGTVHRPIGRRHREAVRRDDVRSGGAKTLGLVGI
jgi:hypothetical protein